VRPQWGKF